MIKVEVCDIATRLVEKLRKYSQPGENVIKIEVEPTINNKEEEHADVEKVETLVKGEVLDDREDVCHKEKSRSPFVQKSETWRNQEQNFDDARISTSGDGGMISASDDGIASNTPPPSLPAKLSKRDKQKAEVGNLICKFYREGRCRKGDLCSYSHNASDSGCHPELCPVYLNGLCKQGLRCNFLHGEFPCKYFHLNKCEDPKCRFSHQPLDEYTKPLFDGDLESDVSANFTPLSSRRKDSRSMDYHSTPQTFNRVSSPHEFLRPSSRKQSHSEMKTMGNLLSSVAFDIPTITPYRPASTHHAFSKPLSKRPIRPSTSFNKHGSRRTAVSYSPPPPRKQYQAENAAMENRLSPGAFDISMNQKFNHVTSSPYAFSQSFAKKPVKPPTFYNKHASRRTDTPYSRPSYHKQSQSENVNMENLLSAVAFDIPTTTSNFYRRASPSHAFSKPLSKKPIKTPSSFNKHGYRRTAASYSPPPPRKQSQSENVAMESLLSSVAFDFPTMHTS